MRTGSVNDGGIWANCELSMALKNQSLNLPPAKEPPGTGTKTNLCLIANEIFPSLPNTIKLYNKAQLRDKERIFNYRLSRTRRTVENAFGILAARWRILLTTICADPKNVEFMVTAVVCLHNFVMSEESEIAPDRRRYCPSHLVDREGIGGQVTNGAWRQLLSQTNLFRDIEPLESNNYNDIIDAQRDIICDYFVSKVGEALTPWQYECVFGSDKMDISE